MNIKLLAFFSFITIPIGTVYSQQLSENIRLNQIGFYPNAPKVAVIVNANAETFMVKTADLKNTVLTGKLSNERQSEFSGKKTQIADFSSLQKDGKYVIEVPTLGISYPFEIQDKVHQDVAKASLKAFFSKEHPRKFLKSMQGNGQDHSLILIPKY
eukprot:Opistho-2@50725